jgi:hypothetical protein
LEEKLSIQDFKISREGKSYADTYPVLKNVDNFLYTWALPLGIASLSVIRVLALLKKQFIFMDRGCGIAAHYDAA